MPRRRSDPLARQAVLGIAAGRIAIGVGAMFVTGPALRALGFAEIDAAGTALGRMAGGRDIALGLLPLASPHGAKAPRAAASGGRGDRRGREGAGQDRRWA